LKVFLQGPVEKCSAGTIKIRMVRPREEREDAKKGAPEGAGYSGNKKNER
jgi:hypothetical protein